MAIIRLGDVIYVDLEKEAIVHPFDLSETELIGEFGSSNKAWGGATPTARS